jgi:sugar transferase (PEP-CTERM/EpsH1 system associated)
MTAWVTEKLAGGRIRDVFLFCSSIWPYLSDAPPDTRVILDMVDIDSEKWGAFAKSAPWPMRGIYKREQRTLFALEKRAARGSGSCLFVSRAEAEAFVRLAPEFAGSADYMENGVDLDMFDCTRGYDNPFASGSAAIVFTGMMNYQPNVEAVAWFAREAMPQILQQHQNAQFWIVGAQPTRAVRRLASAAGVQVTGRVNDVRPYLSNATCVVAPLRIARGIQNKVLEAMAMAKPVVLTHAALAGLNAISGRDVLLARSTSDFVGIVSDVIEGKWPGLGAAARTRIQTDYQWPKNLQRLDALFAPEGMHAASLPTQRSEPLLGEAAT